MITRILLDDCVVRHLAHRDAIAIDLGLLAPRLWKYRISIADPAFAELVDQRLESRLSDAVWASARQDLDRMLDPRWPIFPGGNELSAIVGFQKDLTIDRWDCQRCQQLVWQLLRDSGSSADLRAGFVALDSNGKQRTVRVDEQDLRSRLARDRRDWASEIEDMRSKRDQGEVDFGSLEKTKEYLIRELGRESEDPPDLTSKLDSVITLKARFAWMAMNNKTPYNPRAQGRRGDVFDWSLLFALPLPCVIVTADASFCNALRETGSPQACQVINVDELNEHSRNDTLESVILHCRSADQQEREWREAAYFHWLERGRPNDDSWSDWFASEPIA
jgi:hypothetical protein